MMMALVFVRLAYLRVMTRLARPVVVQVAIQLGYVGN